MQKFKLNFSEKARTTKTEPLTKDLFYRVAGSVDVARIINQLKCLDKNKDKEQYKKLKDKLPMYYPHAVYVDGWRPKEDRCNIKPSGLCMHDLDGMEGDVREIYKEKIEPHIGKDFDLVLAHVSCGGHGIRLVTTLPVGLTLEQYQSIVANTVGLKASQDDSIKDYARGSFFPTTDYILYIDEDRFFSIELPEYEESTKEAELKEAQMKAIVEEASKKPKYDTGFSVVPPVEGAFTVMPSYEGVPLNLFVDEVIKGYCTNGELTENGHQRDNLCFHAALLLRPLVNSNRDVIYGLLAEKMKSVGFGDAEIRQKITSAVSRTAGYIKSPSPEALYILNKLKNEISAVTSELVLPKAPKMPKIIEDVCALFPEWMHDACVLAQLPIWGFMADNAFIKYRGQRYRRLQFSTHIIGGPASGKGFIVSLMDFLMKRFVEHDKEVLEMEEKDRQNRKRKEKRQGEDVVYHTYRKYMLEANITRPQAYVRLNNADGHMMMLFTEEVGEFDTSMRSSTSGFKFVLLKSFDYGEISKSTMSDDSPNITCNVSLNSLTAGVWESTTSHLGNNSDGLLSRNIVVIMPDRLGINGDFDDEDIAPSEKLQKAIDEMSDRLQNIGDGEFTKFEFPAFRDAMKNWFEGPGGVNEQYQDNQDKDWLVLARRAGEIGFRAMALFWFLCGCPKGVNKKSGKHSKKIQEIIDAGLWVAEYVRITQYSIVTSTAVHKKSNEIVLRSGKNKKVFSALPDVFTTLDYINLKKSQGDDPTPSSVYKAIERMLNDGLIKKVGKDRWQKVRFEEETA